MARRNLKETYHIDSYGDIDTWDIIDGLKKYCKSSHNLNDVEEALYRVEIMAKNDNGYYDALYRFLIDASGAYDFSFDESYRRTNCRKIKTEKAKRFYESDSNNMIDDEVYPIDDIADWLYTHPKYGVLFDNLNQAQEASEILWYEFGLEYGGSGYDVDTSEDIYADIKTWIYDNGIMDILGAYDSSGTNLSFHDNYEKWYGKLY